MRDWMREKSRVWAGVPEGTFGVGVAGFARVTTCSGAMGSEVMELVGKAVAGGRYAEGGRIGKDVDAKGFQLALSSILVSSSSRRTKSCIL